MSEIRPFQIAVEDSQLDDLKTRLSNTRFPDELDNAARELGSPLGDVKRLVSYWKDSYDWRKAEAELNQFPQFETTIEIDGFDPLDIHFIHQKSNVENAIPLLWVHGWPGSFYEGIKVIKPLSEGDAPGTPAFHVIVPSLVNFGFSSGPKQRGFAIQHHAEVLHKLMQRLGYTNYATQGGDWGYFITLAMGHLFPDAVKAQNFNFLYVKGPPAFTSAPFSALRAMVTPWSRADKDGLARTLWFLKEGSGYNQIQGTKPQTPGYALADSPSALLAWIYEKLRDWTDEYPWTDDEICTWISIYWFSRAGPAASQRLYYEMKHNPQSQKLGMSMPSKPKLGFSLFPKDLNISPASWRRGLGSNVIFQREHESGGHFASWERPDEVVGDLRDMFKKGGGAYKAVAVSESRL